MSGFFDFFNTHRSGILVFLLFLLVLMLAVNWPTKGKKIYETPIED